MLRALPIYTQLGGVIFTPIQQLIALLLPLRPKNTTKTKTKAFLWLQKRLFGLPANKFWAHFHGISVKAGWRWKKFSPCARFRLPRARKNSLLNNGIALLKSLYDNRDEKRTAWYHHALRLLYKQ